MAKFSSEAEAERIISGMRWMGIFSSEEATIAEGNLLDTLCAQLGKLMSFQPGERDLVMLQHKFVVEWSDQKTVASLRPFNFQIRKALRFAEKPDQETLTSTLELLGDPNRYSAMALSVGVTCGIAAQLLLDDHPALTKPGVLAPYTKEICDPIRALVEKEGVKMVERAVN